VEERFEKRFETAKTSFREKKVKTRILKRSEQVCNYCCRQLTVLEQKMNSDVVKILQIVRESKLQHASSPPPPAADVASPSTASLSQTVETTQVYFSGRVIRSACCVCVRLSVCMCGRQLSNEMAFDLGNWHASSP